MRFKFPTNKNGQKKKKEDWVTPDFNKMVSIVSWNSLGFFFTEFIIPYVSSEILGGEGIQIGFLFSLIIIGASFSSLLAGYLTDRYSKRILVLIGALGRGIAYLIIYLSILFRSFPLMNVGTLILGLLVGMYWVPFDHMLSEKSSKDHRSYAFGKRHGAMGKGIFIGGVIGTAIFGICTYLVPDMYWLVFSPMLIYFVSNLIGGILIYKRVDETIVYSADSDEKEEKLEEVKGNLNIQTKNFKKMPKGFIIGFILLLSTYFLSSVNNFIAKPFVQVYILQNINDNPLFVLMAYAPAGTITMLIAPKLGEIVDNINPYIGIVTFSILGGLETFFLISVGNIWLFSIVLLFDAILGNATNLLLQNIFSRISIKNRGKVIGTGTSIGNLGGGVGPIFGGLAWDSYGSKMPFIISIFVELGLIAPYFASYNQIKPHLAEKTDNNATEEMKDVLFDAHSD